MGRVRVAEPARPGPARAGPARPGLILHPWVRLLIWLALTTIWVVTSAFLLRTPAGVDADR